MERIVETLLNVISRFGHLLIILLNIGAGTILTLALIVTLNAFHEENVGVEYKCMCVAIGILFTIYRLCDVALGKYNV